MANGQITNANAFQHLSKRDRRLVRIALAGYVRTQIDQFHRTATFDHLLNEEMERLEEILKALKAD